MIILRSVTDNQVASFSQAFASSFIVKKETDGPKAV